MRWFFHTMSSQSLPADPREDLGCDSSPARRESGQVGDPPSTVISRYSSMEPPSPGAVYRFLTLDMRRRKRRSACGSAWWARGLLLGPSSPVLAARDVPLPWVGLGEQGGVRSGSKAGTFTGTSTGSCSLPLALKTALPGGGLVLPPLPPPGVPLAQGLGSPHLLRTSTE